MTERTTLARPYAEAAFRLATERKTLKEWSSRLALMAAVARDPQMAALAGNPRVARERFIEFFLDVCSGKGGKIETDGANFVRLLSENHRFALLPEIAELFEARRAEAEGRVEAEAISATALSDAQLKSISAALKKRLGREIDLTTRIDTTLLGGVVIRAGDLVIDGSVQGKLQLLATHLNR
ncbi:MAG: F0F1 ATP synthase subunit delta [Gammaproteobacteria bacterium]|nr:F0F1 ATP synthase subunit delta [Gammaproteobacteria bacterium]